MEQYSLGIDIGYSAVKVVLITTDNQIVFTSYKAHLGQIKKSLEDVFSELNKTVVDANIAHGAITGSIGTQLARKGLLHKVNEVAAAIEGSLRLHPEAQSIIEIGGQSAKYYTGFNGDKKHALRISKHSMLKVSSNSNCAAGTGSFLEEQASRLNIKVEDFFAHTQNAKTIPRIAGRCSVFAKTDIIHQQQEGVPTEDILKGLAYAIVKNYKSAVIRGLPLKKPILLIGGVAHNLAIAAALRDVLNLDTSSLIIPQHFDTAVALGAALIAKKENYHLNLSQVPWNLLIKDEESTRDKPLLPPLNQVITTDTSKKHHINTKYQHDDHQGHYIGIDIGSTSVNLVVLNSQKNLVDYKYIRSLGKPYQAVIQGLKSLYKSHGKPIILGLGITGSGRHLIGRKIGADVIKDEITAQAKGAMNIDPEVDTIFEIGGQDSKYIRINNGVVTDFQMNKVCAAGTGSFLDEQAQKFNIPINEMGTLALKGKHPVDLGERCTVFMGSSITSNLSKGTKPEDIMAGLAYSIAKNYLHRVVGQKPIGNKIFLQGGIAHNQGVVNALKILTGKALIIPPFFSVTGAYGAAVMAFEEMQDQDSKFIGLKHLDDSSDFKIKPKEERPIAKTDHYQNHLEKLIFQNYSQGIDTNKKTIGIPRSLFAYGMFPMYNALFTNLGFNVLLSDWSNDDIAELGQKYASQETCFPIKLVTGHVANLLTKGVDYIFFPKLYNVSRPEFKSRQSYACAYMQLAPQLIELALGLKEKGIQLLSPIIANNKGPEYRKQSFIELGAQLGKTEADVNKALKQGMTANQNFEQKITSLRKKAQIHLDNNATTFVIISKMYGVSDPRLNLGIPEMLIKMGYHVLPFFELPIDDSSNNHPNMFWPFGQYILNAAHVVRQHPNLQAIFLSHHGCGPDSIITHYVKEIMGNKPYLNIEVDEHASKVGITTRIEAFVNSVSRDKSTPTKSKTSTDPLNGKKLPNKEKLTQLPIGTKVYIPNIYPYSTLLGAFLMHKGISAEVLSSSQDQSLSLGRQFTSTNEYYSLTALLGDCFYQLNSRKGHEPIAFMVPQTEGAEVASQYNRLLKTKLDEAQYSNTHVFAPFLEDLILINHKDTELIFQCLLAGDLIRVAAPHKRAFYLDEVKTWIVSGTINHSQLRLMAQQIHRENIHIPYQKRLLVIGEPLIVFNDYLNANTLRKLEKDNYKVMSYSMAEAMWMFWRDFIDQNKRNNRPSTKALLLGFKQNMMDLAKDLKGESPFADDAELLWQAAHTTIGYQAGAFARYRQAKTRLHPSNIDGILTVNSTYENTGVGLHTINQAITKKHTTPLLNLSFDGNTNENDKNKVESFIYYL